MSGRDVYNTSVVTAGAAKVATVSAAALTAQVTIDAANSVVGYNLQSGSFATLAAAVAAANLAKRNTVYAAEQAKQAALAVARDTLRAAGDLAAF